MKNNLLSATIMLTTFFAACKKDDVILSPISGKDITKAEKVSVDRFSSAAGHLMVRNASNGLPEANAAIDYDKAPFITTGLNPSGVSVMYYNFDVQPLAPAPIYAFFNAKGEAVSGQNNIIDVIPGDAGYNDFWLVNKVTVPDNYVANSISSYTELKNAGYTISSTTTIVNCPVVPFGSTAAKSKDAGVASALTLGWYKGKAVAYFNFGEAPLMTTTDGKVPTSPIYVMFNDDAAGPSSGFRVETGTAQTHNVIATKPGDTGYSPLWDVRVISNTYFSSVMDLATATAAPSNPAGATVNCPVVK